MIENWPTPAEAARELGLSTERVRQLMEGGRLTFVRTRLGRLVDPDSVAALQRERARVRGAA